MRLVFELSDGVGSSATHELGDLEVDQVTPGYLIVSMLECLYPTLSALAYTLHAATTATGPCEPLDVHQIYSSSFLRVVIGGLIKEQLGEAASPNPLWNPNSRSTTPASETPSYPSTPTTPPTTTHSSTPPITPANVARALRRRRDPRADRESFQAKLRALCYARDQRCCITGDPESERLQCAHVMTPEYADELFSQNRNMRRLLLRIPTIIRRSGLVDRAEGYDVRNGFMLVSTLHTMWDRFHWSIIASASGELRTYCFKRGAVAADVPIRMPNPMDFPGSEEHFISQFPPPEFFREHFKEAVKRNFIAAGRRPFDDLPPSDDEMLCVDEEEESDLEGLPLEDKVILRALESSDTCRDLEAVTRVPSAQARYQILSHAVWPSSAIYSHSLLDGSLLSLYHTMRPSGILIDLSGYETLHVDSEPVPGAIEALKKLRESNIQVITSLTAARNLIAARGLRPMLFLSDDAESEFAGLDCSNPNAVVIGLAAKKFAYHELNKAFRTLMDNKDVLKAADGLSLGPGAFVSALECATGRTAEVIGKPSPSFFRTALNELQLPADQVAMIGDDVRDDVVGAMQCGMLGFLVRTGKWRPGDDEGVEDITTFEDFGECIESILASEQDN
ncbi:HAD-like domain-containing protein [Gaertneriomyces semiglobifer]|nr:HAD-like domain-containing protein [Gaertneriomyces semiglobifer]